MAMFRRSSAAESAPGQHAAPVQVDGPVLEPLTTAEVDWVRSVIAGLVDQDVRLGDIDELGRHYDEMLQAWLRLPAVQRPDPDGITNQIGLAFGQYVADHARLDWTVATDEQGTSIALRRAAGSVLFYPTDLVAQRWAAHKRKTLPAMARDMIATVEQTV